MTRYWSRNSSGCDSLMQCLRYTLGFMRKHLLMATLILGYIVTTPLLAIGPGGMKRVMKNGSRFTRGCLRVLGVKVRVRGTPVPGIIVSNHQSYIDILTILAMWPCRFISFTELADVPGVGLIAALSQTLLVHRSKPTLVKRDIETFERELRKGVPFVFFPEGGSFDGSYLRPFKSPLFESAIRTGTSIQPLCLRYLSIDGEPVTTANRDEVFYHGDIELLSQLLGILRLRSIEIEAVFGEPILVHGKTRKELAHLAHQEVGRHHLSVPQI
jgi:1-acyl-sn-glycerol-3-phosphate acyltransferase